MNAMRGAHRSAWRLAVPLALPAALAIGQEAPPVAQLPSITVSADKVERALDQVPASVAVLDGQEIEQSHLTRLDQLEGRVPGLSFQPFGQPGMKSPVMRGLTASIFSYSTSVLMVVDGVPTLTAQGFENDLMDIDRIEVLRGPQSTLYGRNAESGVIAIYSKPMDDTPRASVAAETGTQGRRGLRMSLSRPLVEDKLYASLSASWRREGGFIRNRYTGGKADGREHQDLKAGLRWRLGPDSEVVLRYARQHYHDGANLWGSVDAPRAQVWSGTPSWNRSLGQTMSLDASHTFGNGWRLRAITAYNDFRDKVQQDTDFQPADLLHIGRDSHLRTTSQELRLEGNWGRAEWLAGVYADRGRHDLRNTSKRGVARQDYGADLKTGAWAVFTNWTWPLGQDWTLSGGARLERSAVALHPDDASRQRKAWTHLLPRLALQYQFDPDHQWYASVSRGVRAGGYNVFVSALNYPAYAPERSWSYETGMKGWLLQRRLRYSVAAYFMDVDNMQVMMQPVPGVNYIASAATARSQGLELEMDYLLGRGWQLRAGLAWNRTTFDRFRDGAADYAGHRNPFAPALSGRVGVRYEAANGSYVQADVVGTSKIYLDPANDYSRRGYALLNLTAGYQQGDWEISAYINNLTDKRYDAVGYQGGFVTVYSPPREAGLRLTWRM